MSRFSAIALLAITILAGLAPAAEEDPQAALIQDFQKRVSTYVQLHKTVESSLPKLKSTPEEEKISHHQHELARAIRAARNDAKPGDIFTPQIAAEFRRLIAMAMKADGKGIATSLQHSEPVHLHLRVNEAYPANIPLQSTPPSLLLNLPKLPQEVEYRIEGRGLVLLDGRANMVVDLIEDVFS
jgi:hypothetical protein